MFFSGWDAVQDTVGYALQGWFVPPKKTESWKDFWNRTWGFVLKRSYDVIRHSQKGYIKVLAVISLAMCVMPVGSSKEEWYTHFFFFLRGFRVSEPASKIGHIMVHRDRQMLQRSCTVFRFPFKKVCDSKSNHLFVRRLLTCYHDNASDERYRKFGGHVESYVANGNLHRKKFIIWKPIAHYLETLSIINWKHPKVKTSAH